MIDVEGNMWSKASFKEVYNTYYPKLVRFAVQYVISPHEAENIVQNIFLQLLEKESDFGDLYNINAYLFRSVKNRCIDFLRDKIRNGNRKQSLDDTAIKELALKMAAIEQFDDSALSLGELEQAIRNAVESLPEKCREIFIKSRFEGMSHADIADDLGLAASTVNNQINTALRKLKEELKYFLPLFIFLSC